MRLLDFLYRLLGALFLQGVGVCLTPEQFLSLFLAIGHAHRGRHHQLYVVTLSVDGGQNFLDLFSHLLGHLSVIYQSHFLLRKLMLILVHALLEVAVYLDQTVNIAVFAVAKLSSVEGKALAKKGRWLESLQVKFETYLW